MDFFLRLTQFIMTIIYGILYWMLPHISSKTKSSKIPRIRNGFLTISLVEVMQLLQKRKLKSQTLVKAYIERIKEVEPLINALVYECFDDAIEDAIRADELIAETPDEELPALFERFPLLGAPFSVKESCGLKGMPFRVGSRQRANMKCPKNGKVVNNLVNAGAIPLLVSVTPEYCFSIESNPATQDRCLNAHNDKRTAGGSSGGEGALNGAGATLFGVGSDIAGSIRIPSLFNGVFGHKPTGGVTSIVGHFPNCGDEDGPELLQLGPITRFGCDLSLLMQVMAGKSAEKLDLKSKIETKDIKVFYAFGFQQLNGFLHKSPVYAMKLSIKTAVKSLKKQGCITEKMSMHLFKNSVEMSISGLVLLQDFPYLINRNSPNKILAHFIEFIKALLGISEYTKEAIYFDILRHINGFMKTENMKRYRAEAKILKAKLTEMLGDNGVLLFPTFPVPAIHHNTSLLALWNIDYTMIFNILGFPATHVPLGRDKDNLPVGFQVIAAPYKDRLCFQIASELEVSLGGWVIPKTEEEQNKAK